MPAAEEPQDTPENRARKVIDAQLSAAGWLVAASGSPVGHHPIALCELSGSTGRADYVLYLDGKACGIIEAKRADHTLEGVQEQSATYSAFRTWQDSDTCWQNPLPVPLPPLAEQHQIVAEVEARATAIDHLEAELDRQITRSNRLQQSILTAAFSGFPSK